MWSISLLAVLASSNLILAVALYRTRGIGAKYRRSQIEQRAGDKFQAFMMSERDAERRAYEIEKDDLRADVRRRDEIIRDLTVRLNGSKAA